MNLKSEHTPNSKSFIGEVTFCITAWSNTYQTTLQPLFRLQRKVLRIITFPSYNEHSSPLFKDLNVVKLLFYGTFNIRFQGAKVWNDISDDIKLLPLKYFKKN